MTTDEAIESRMSRVAGAGHPAALIRNRRAADYPAGTPDLTGYVLLFDCLNECRTCAQYA
jgi:hypothetical protein